MKIDDEITCDLSFDLWKNLKKAVDALTNEQLDEALLFVEKIKNQDIQRKSYIELLLKKEQNLFDRLAQWLVSN